MDNIRGQLQQKREENSKAPVQNRGLNISSELQIIQATLETETRIECFLGFYATWRCLLLLLRLKSTAA